MGQVESLNQASQLLRHVDIIIYFW